MPLWNLGLRCADEGKEAKRGIGPTEHMVFSAPPPILVRGEGAVVSGVHPQEMEQSLGHCEEGRSQLPGP
jgi:hypothetical protein